MDVIDGLSGVLVPPELMAFVDLLVALGYSLATVGGAAIGKPPERRYIVVECSDAVARDESGRCLGRAVMRLGLDADRIGEGFNLDCDDGGFYMLWEGVWGTAVSSSDSEAQALTYRPEVTRVIQYFAAACIKALLRLMGLQVTAWVAIAEFKDHPPAIITGEGALREVPPVLKPHIRLRDQFAVERPGDDARRRAA